jgi:hypothetical protein
MGSMPADRTLLSAGAVKYVVDAGAIPRSDARGAFESPIPDRSLAARPAT